MIYLQKQLLEKLSIARLKNILKGVRAVIGGIPNKYGHRCCELCKEWVYREDNFEEKVKLESAPYIEYKNLVISILKEKQALNES